MSDNVCNRVLPHVLGDMMTKKQNPGIYFLADTHFGHEKIIEYCDRPFSSVGEMDSVMIERWNRIVQPKDVVYFLGDFCMGNQEMAFSYFRRLNGQIYVIPGGHDKKWIRPNLCYTGPNCVVRICPPLHTVTLDGQVIVLCHFAMRVWDRSHFNSWQLHGHSHGGLLGVGKQMDVGVDCWDFYPVALETVRRKMERQPDNFNLVKSSRGKLTGTGATADLGLPLNNIRR